MYSIFVKMEDRKPIKRSNELVPLSRDHHSGLLLCWKIRTGIKNGIDEKRIAAYVVFYYQSQLSGHFRQEEEYVFTLSGPQDSMIQKALDEHREINNLVAQLENNTSTGYAVLEQLADKLDDHIRYEERELFPYIEQNVASNLLVSAGEIIAELHNDINEPAWEDEFWARTA